MKLCIVLAATLLLGVASFIDLKWKILPDSTTIAIAVLGVLCLLSNTGFCPIAGEPVRCSSFLQSAVSIFSPSLKRVLLVFVCSVLLVLPGWMGFGDAKLFPALSLFFPTARSFFVFYGLTFFVNGLIAVLGLVLKKWDRKGEVPMGPAIFVSFVFCQLSILLQL